MAVPIWKRMLKWCAWLVGGALALVIVAYLGLLAINWRDQPPNESALRLAAAYRDRPAVADADNAYVYVLGFGVAPDADSARQSRRSDTVRKIADTCRRGSPECAAALESSEDAIREWLDSEQWLLDRDLQLLEHEGWSETITGDLQAPLPSYTLVLDGQRLLLAKAYVLANQQDAGGARELLANDALFWRGVLA